MATVTYFGQSIEDLGNGASLALPFAESSTAATIARLASAMNHIGGTEFPVQHYFANNLYAREMSMPAGSLLISHIHREQHICTCSAGAILVFQTGEDSANNVNSINGTRIIEAPFTFVSEPNTQRVGFTLADTVWTSYHATSERDIDVLESTLYDKRPFPPYIDGDAELIIGWLEQLGRVPLLDKGKSAKELR